MTRFADPAWLCLLALAPSPWLWGRRRARLIWPTLSGFGDRRFSIGSAQVFGTLPRLARGLAIACLAVAMARPQEPGGQISVAGRGVAIVGVLDRSPSMKTADFPSKFGPISRLEAAKLTLARFIRGRDDDLIGLVQFANTPELLAAPTPDQRFLLEAVQAIRPAGAADVGTSLGDSVVEGLGALRGVSPRRKVLILLTDGRNQPAVPRPVDPIQAAEMARDLGVTLHAIAVGDPSRPGDEGPDLPLLKRMAEITGGRAFEASETSALDRVFEQIDELEKSPVVGTIRTVYRELYAPWAAVGLALLAVDLLLAAGRFRRLP